MIERTLTTSGRAWISGILAASTETRTALSALLMRPNSRPPRPRICVRQCILFPGQLIEVGPLLDLVERAASLFGVSAIRDRERRVDQPDYDLDFTLRADARRFNRDGISTSGDRQGGDIGRGTRTACRRGGGNPRNSAQSRAAGKRTRTILVVTLVIECPSECESARAERIPGRIGTTA